MPGQIAPGRLVFNARAGRHFAGNPNLPCLFPRTILATERAPGTRNPIGSGNFRGGCDSRARRSGIDRPRRGLAQGTILSGHPGDHRSRRPERRCYRIGGARSRRGSRRVGRSSSPRLEGKAVGSSLGNQSGRTLRPSSSSSPTPISNTALRTPSQVFSRRPNRATIS